MAQTNPQRVEQPPGKTAREITVELLRAKVAYRRSHRPFNRVLRYQPLKY